MVSWIKAMAALAGLSAVVAATGANAVTLVGPDSFGAMTLTESFEGITPGAGFTDAGNGFVVPVGPALGMSFLPAGIQSPLPNPGLAGGIVIADWANGAPQLDLGANGLTLPGSIPDGTAHLAMIGNGTWTIGISPPVCPCDGRIGFVWTAGSPTVDFQFTFENAPPLDLTLPSVPVGEWGDNFLGVHHGRAILSVTVSGTDVVIDQFRIENRVPEPAALLLIGGALAGILAARRR